ncbi:MAG: PLP-dependent cysteine synthase family protein [Bdellovibrionales bacterium]|nr:PLP-dependent cysteine synthase family protein [Bdellovibrionales bacterium]
MSQCRTWLCQAINEIERDFYRSADTHLFKIEIPEFENIDFYLKDESTHPTGSLKHRLARSLFLYGLCNGKIKSDTVIIEASSGSTAISEAYFARLLGLKFIAVMPRGTSKEKIAQIEFYGGQCHLVDDHRQVYETAEHMAKNAHGYYMDQFTYAEQATDWRGNNNIADSIFDQMKRERFSQPTWIVVGAGTGGTSATIGRYIRYQCKNTKLCIVDPEYSVFYSYFHSKDASETSDQASLIEGIGRPRVEPSFVPSVIDEVLQIPNAASIAAIYWLEKKIGKRCGGSTGTNMIGAFSLASQMIHSGTSGSIVSMICDGGERYSHTYYNSDWIRKQGLDVKKYEKKIENFMKRKVFEL